MGSKLTAAVTEIAGMANVRYANQFVMAVVEGIGWLSAAATFGAYSRWPRLAGSTVSTPLQTWASSETTSRMQRGAWGCCPNSRAEHVASFVFFSQI